MSSIELLTEDDWTALLNEIDCSVTFVMLTLTSKFIKRRVTRFAKINRIKWSFNCENIASTGYLEVLKWALSHGHSWDKSASIKAAKYGHLLKRSLNDKFEVSEVGSMNSLKHLPDDVWIALLNVINCRITMVTLSHTCKIIKRQVVRFAILNKIPWSLKCSDIAAKGYLNILKWARKLGCDWNSDTCANAALHGHLKLLKWALNNGSKKWLSLV